MRLLALLVGCNEDPAAPAGDTGWPAGLEIGVGDDLYTPLEDGDPVGIATAGQGGVHVELTIRVSGMSRYVAVTPILTQTSTGEVLTIPSNPTYIDLSDFDPATCAGQLSVQALLDRTLASACALDGAPVEAWVEIENLDTHEVVSDGVEVTATLTDAVRAACAR